MAGTAYTHRGHSNHNGGRPHSDEWNKGDYPAEQLRYVETTETTEVFYSPLTPEYRHYDSPKVTRHSSPVHDSPKQAEELISKLQIEASRPGHHVRHSTRHHGTPGYGNYEYDHDYKKNKEFLHPNKNDDCCYDKRRTTAPTLSPPRRPTHHSTRPSGSPGYDDYYHDKNNTTDPYYADELLKPDAYYRSHDDGFDRPIHATVNKPHSHNAKLGLPTNNIDEAIGPLKGSLKPMFVNTTHPTTRYSAVPKYVDSLKTGKEHDKYQSPTGHVMTSDEVAEKYHAQLIRN